MYVNCLAGIFGEKEVSIYVISVLLLQSSPKTSQRKEDSAYRLYYRLKSLFLKDDSLARYKA